jgi:hypothetical protein
MSTTKKLRKAKPCPHCGRAGSTCWVMPCLHLSCVLAEGPVEAINTWLKIVGAPFTVRSAKVGGQ